MRLGLLVPSKRPALDETRPASLRKADVDDIEVPGYDSLREDRARLARDLGSEVAVRQVSERKHLHAGRAGKLSDVDGGRMQRLVGSLLFLGGERRLVDEEIGFARRLEHDARRPGIAGQHDLSPRTGRSQHLVGPDLPTVRRGDRFAGLEPSEQRALRDPERPRSLHVEAPRPLGLDELVAVGVHTVLDVEDGDPVIAPVESVAGSQLDQLELVCELAENPPKRAEQLDESGRPVHGQRHLTPAERERLEHPGKAEVVVGVIVGDEDLGKLDQADRGAQELALGAFAAVEEHALAAPAYERARQAAFGRRNRARGAQKDEVEVHERSVSGGGVKPGGAAADIPRGAVANITMRQRVSRSLTLLWAFVGMSALILALGALVLGMILTQALRDQALADAKTSLTQYTNGVLGPHLRSGPTLEVNDEARGLVESDLGVRSEIISVKVWRPDGVLVWATIAKERMGERFPLSRHLEEVLMSGEAEAEFENLSEEEDAVESGLGVDHVLEVYAPILSEQGQVLGAYEIYADSSDLEASIVDRKRVIWIATAAVFAVLWLLLALLARSASGTMRRQTTTLRERSLALGESYRRLEQSSLEAIAILNAAVEAKDPYTAGHSARVQRIALAVASELGFSPVELDAVRYGGLFHDIGKIAIPDILLTKPHRLTRTEYELMKTHSAEGARIVGKFGRLHECVPIIRHHHERFDGDGYPDGLAGEEIPLPAAVVGLADAWDAMTIERPYQRARSIEQAIEEVRNGRGTQFVPAVVDAFFDALRRNPADLGVSTEISRAAG
jgi:putative nucleotidyltransferase with HDIG domain